MSPKPMLQQQWYVRQGGRIRGPLPDVQVTRDILLGRIRRQDEISADREHWLRPGALPQLVPEILKSPDSEQARQHLLLARLREDERVHERRATAYAPAASNRRLGDRRTVESFDGAVFQEIAAPSADPEERDERNLLLPVALVMIGLFIFVVYLFSGGIRLFR